MVTIGLIGGSGLLKTSLKALQSLTEETVDTAHGRVFLRCGAIADGVTLVFIQRHDARPSRTYTQPGDINYAAIALALKAKQVDYVVGICSVGSLKESIDVGALVVADDYYCPYDLRRVYTDFRAHLMPGFDESLRAAIIKIVRSLGFHPLTHGTYVNSAGPRFETKAEIKVMAQAGEIVGMTGAHEAGACVELGLPYAMLCMVDNFANGIGEKLTLEAFHHAQAANLAVVEQCVAALLSSLPSIIPAKGATAGEGASSSSEGATGGAGAAPATPPTVDLIVNAKYLVPLAPGAEQTVLLDHAVVVKDGKIIHMGPKAEVAATYRATRVVDVSDRHALMPGLVNAHTHLPLNLLRGIADDLPLAQWLTEQIWPTEARLVSSEFCEAGARAAAAELIKSGVTCINEMYWYPDATAKAVAEAGMRGMLGMVILEFPSSYASNAGEYIARGMEIRAAWEAKQQGLDPVHKRVSFAFGPHAPYTVSDPTFHRIRDLAAATGAKVHLHLHETEGEVTSSKTGAPGPTKHMSDSKASPVDNLADMGLLNDKLIAVHMTQLTDEEIAKVAAAGTSVVHCPNSNLKLASGFCPIAKLLKAGVNVAIGTDSASSNNSLDFFQELKLAAVLAKGVSGDATAVPAWQALRMATYNGAKALGLESVTGSLEVGKAADMIAVDLGGLEQSPMFSVLSHLVYATDRKCVTDVWVAGQQLLGDRALLTIDEDKVLADVKTWAEKARPGLSLGVPAPKA